MVRGLDPSSYWSGKKPERKSHRNPVALEDIAKDNEWTNQGRKQKTYVVACFHQKERVVPRDINKEEKERNE